MRLFVAIPIPDEVRRRLIAISSGVRNARWVRPEGMHITLFFAGETDRQQARDLDAELEHVRLPAFDIRCNGLGYFERGSVIKSIWAGIETNPTLAHLQGRVESAGVRAGFPHENRKFKPHVTLARLKGGRAEDVGPWIEAHDPLMLEPFTADRFVLYRSHLSGEGALYEPLVEYLLTTPDYAAEFATDDFMDDDTV